MTTKIQPSRTLSESRLTSSGVRALMNALASNVALLDGDGIIVATNTAWDEYASTTGADLHQAGVGCDYLAICDQAASDLNVTGARFGAGLRSVLLGQTPSFELDDRLLIEGVAHVIRGRATRIEDPTGTWVLVVHQDVSLAADSAA